MQGKGEARRQGKRKKRRKVSNKQKREARTVIPHNTRGVPLLLGGGGMYADRPPSGPRL